MEYKGPDKFSPEWIREKMRTIYREKFDEISNNAPKSLGNSVQFSFCVDTDHAGNSVTRRSQTGILIVLNMAPMYWFSKKTEYESSTFDSEFVVLKIATEKTMA